ncbi:hypothetical protein DES36_10374 [Alkalibaculum bacchi]|uniref:Calcineurin-like phosphoesterase domain-containing protein n=1 Tax=Alkalibaculum bacchi TaxID=645887 RepID=A0A366IE04_9FIRM|nr:metallophosphoesterase [Alkalibaculum bacchi]RBP68313.1 hypothetical protein DES36_10374 [Alkalibaculum bacchi]
MIKINKRIYGFVIALIVIFIIYALWQNNCVRMTKYEYKNAKIPEGFNGYRILQISDLHNKNFHGLLDKLVEESNPDIIVITGDLIDRRNTDIKTATELVKRLSIMVPTYYVTGNHEQLSDKYNELMKEMKKLDVRFLDNSYITLSNKGDEVGLMGVADPAIVQSESTYLWNDNQKYMIESIKELYKNVKTNFNILLSHRPELLNVYKDSGVDLVFSGHAHGGQVILPLIGALVAPNQGFIPKYTEGIYSKNSTSMAVSRGLGNSIIPIRINNPPELVLITLKRE